MTNAHSLTRNPAQGDTTRLLSHLKGRWALTATLMAGLLAACDSADSVAGPEEEGAPAEAGVPAEAGALAEAPLGAEPRTFSFEWADGYAWADQPTATSYNPEPSYAFNRSGGAIQITKPAGTTGQYLVRFTGLSAELGPRSTVKVTGYGMNNQYCKPAVPKLTGDVVDVRCLSRSSGAPINAQFTVLVTRSWHDLAFAHGSSPTGTNYAPPTGSSWNPAGAIRVSRSGTGQYQVRFTGLGSLFESKGNGGHAQAVAVGTGNQHCKVVSWGGSPDPIVGVQCLTQAGSPADTKFNVLFVAPSAHLAYAWADKPSSPSYTPAPFFSSNSAGGAVLITRRGRGQYTVTFSGMTGHLLDGGDVQVTAYGPGNAQCKVESWGSESVHVRCFSPSGTLMDSRYTVLLGS